MTLQELASKLTSLGYPVAYSHFVHTEERPVPSPPFICYLVTSSDNFSADNNTYHEIINVDIELYTVKKDLTIEQALKNLLRSNDLPFDYSSIYLDEEGIYKTTYEVSLC